MNKKHYGNSIYKAIMPMFFLTLCSCGISMMNHNVQALQTIPIGSKKDDVLKQLKCSLKDPVPCFVIAKGDFGEVEACDCMISGVTDPNALSYTDDSKWGEFQYLNNLFFHNGIYKGWGRRSTFLNTFYAQLEQEKTMGQKVEVQPNQDLSQQDTPPGNPVSDKEVKLTELKSLYDKGLITKEEYDKKRNKILDAL